MSTTNPPQQPPAKNITVLPSSSQADYIHDIKFDYYGRRIATCSGDQRVTVYNLDEGGSWVLKPGCEWKAHKGVVWRCAWAHPEFGQLLATCGADQMAHIWEEQEGGFDNHGSTPSGLGSGLHTRWVQKAQLTEARKAVNCIEVSLCEGGEGKGRARGGQDGGKMGARGGQDEGKGRARGGKGEGKGRGG
ncbi:hypothetical protein TrCOL_g236 [Triparma columacea]|uniref:Uncharacterized protein n=1 Tax=Triparma columacea TaxID=722753 RepID=A0A9W7G1S9_9STRA|nr:hypothetical protein TrCOL_g236 [Triparma columacea]